MTRTGNGQVLRWGVRMALGLWLAVAGAALAAGAESGISAAGCRTALLLIQEVAPPYAGQGGPTLAAEGTGNKTAGQKLADGEISFAFTCLPHGKMVEKFALDPALAERWATRRIARDPVVVVVNGQNPLAGLSKEQLTGIFSGRITRWDEVGGPPLEIAVTYQDDPADFSGVIGVFKENTVGLKGELVADQRKLYRPEERGAFVAAHAGAVSFMGLKAYRPEYGRLLAIDGVLPDPERVLDGSYPLAATYYIVYDKARGAEAQAFLDYLASAEGRALMERNFVADLE